MCCHLLSEILQAAIESAATFGESDSEVDVLASQSPSPKRRKTHSTLSFMWAVSDICKIAASTIYILLFVNVSLYYTMLIKVVERDYFLVSYL